MSEPTDRGFPLDLVRRIRRDYLATPDLRLTIAQAQRLWSADRADCVVALAALTEAGFLLCADDDRYERRHAGSPTGAATAAREAPWDCRWAEPVLASPAPAWMDAHFREWTCSRDGRPRTLEVQRCFSCPRWEPRLPTRRRRR